LETQGDTAVASDSAADTAPGDVGGTGVCPYVCVIDCQCKKASNGCDLPECESTECLSILAKISALKPKVQVCKAAVGCATFEFPLCGSAGCFQTPVAQDANLDELTGLAAQAMDAKCSSFSCGCDLPEPSFCLKGQCRQCPPDCDGTCDELLGAIVQIATSAAAWCGTDADCTVLPTGLCPVAGLPCGGAPVNKYMKTTQLQALLAQYAVPCNAAMCKCAVPGPALCEKGKCVIK